jgi:acetyl esterase/lipase
VRNLIPAWKVRISMFAIALAVGVFMAETATAAEVEIIPDVVYGHKDGLALTFDVFKPKANSTGAAVLFMVSGGWVSTWAPPAQTASRFQPLLDKGFTVIAVRHGSSPKYFIPEIVDDVRRAVRFTRYNAAKWGINPDRLGVFGGSAGGHLSLMLADASDDGDPTATEPFMRVSDRIASVVAYFPPVDLRAWARGAVPVAEGQPFPALNFDRAKAADYSPLLHVTRDDPPTLLIHGDADPLVNISHSQQMFKALQDAGVKSQFITIPGAGHGFRGADSDKAEAAMVKWFEDTLAKK